MNKIEVMDINYFYSEFKKEMEYLLDEGIFRSKPNEDELTPHAWTMMVNAAVFLIVDKYNNSKSSKLNIMPENKVGRGGYSDFCITNSSGNRIFLEVEHENFPGKSKSKYRLEMIVKKLKKSKADCKVIISYSFPQLSEQKIKELILNYQKRYKILGTIYLILGKYNLKYGKQFKITKCP